MCFAIHYQFFVRNGHGAEVPFNGSAEVVLLVCFSAFGRFARTETLTGASLLQ